LKQIVKEQQGSHDLRIIEEGQNENQRMNGKVNEEQKMQSTLISDNNFTKSQRKRFNI
jgi:hypothetical protein